jgi:hypothetical protein
MIPCQRAAMHSVDQTLRSILLWICGIALSTSTAHRAWSWLVWLSVCVEIDSPGIAHSSCYA